MTKQFIIQSDIINTVAGTVEVETSGEWGQCAVDAQEHQQATGFDGLYLAGMCLGQRVLMYVSSEGCEIAQQYDTLTWLGRDGYDSDDEAAEWMGPAREMVDQGLMEMLFNTLDDKCDTVRLEQFEPLVGHSVGDSHIYTTLSMDAVREMTRAMLRQDDAVRELVGNFESLWRAELAEAEYTTQELCAFVADRIIDEGEYETQIEDALERRFSLR